MTIPINCHCIAIYHIPSHLFSFMLNRLLLRNTFDFYLVSSNAKMFGSKNDV